MKRINNPDHRALVISLLTILIMSTVGVIGYQSYKMFVAPSEMTCLQEMRRDLHFKKIQHRERLQQRARLERKKAAKLETQTVAVN